MFLSPTWDFFLAFQMRCWSLSRAAWILDHLDCPCLLSLLQPAHQLHHISEVQMAMSMDRNQIAIEHLMICNTILPKKGKKGIWLLLHASDMSYVVMRWFFLSKQCPQTSPPPSAPSSLQNLLCSYSFQLVKWEIVIKSSCVKETMNTNTQKCV